MSSAGQVGDQRESEGQTLTLEAELFRVVVYGNHAEEIDAMYA